MFMHIYTNLQQVMCTHLTIRSLYAAIDVDATFCCAGIAAT